MRGFRDSTGKPTKPAARKGFLSRLRTAEAGNTLAIGAAALLPLIGLVGGGVDMSRMYIVKTRLQHACDAGALAGRLRGLRGTRGEPGGWCAHAVRACA